MSGTRNEYPCHGCGHSAAGEPWPGKPSGERPCMFCTRNPKQAEQLSSIQSTASDFKSPRYDNKRCRFDQPIGDQYISTYRLLRDIEDQAHIVT